MLYYCCCYSHPTSKNNLPLPTNTHRYHDHYPYPYGYYDSLAPNALTCYRLLTVYTTTHDN